MLTDTLLDKVVAALQETAVAVEKSKAQEITSGVKRGLSVDERQLAIDVLLDSIDHLRAAAIGVLAASKRKLAGMLAASLESRGKSDDEQPGCSLCKLASDSAAEGSPREVSEGSADLGLDASGGMRPAADEEVDPGRRAGIDQLERNARAPRDREQEVVLLGVGAAVRVDRQRQGGSLLRAPGGIPGAAVAHALSVL